MNDLLTEAELEQLTGAKQASIQRRVLEDHGIFAITRNDKTVTTTWHAVHNPAKRLISGDDEPDFSQVT